MLGDALVYGFSLHVDARNDAWKAVSALMKAGIMAFLGIFVLTYAVCKHMRPEVPAFETIGLVALLALAANLVCFLLLWRHCVEDVNMRSVPMLCAPDRLAGTPGRLRVPRR